VCVADFEIVCPASAVADLRLLGQRVCLPASEFSVPHVLRCVPECVSAAGEAGLHWNQRTDWCVVFVLECRQHIVFTAARCCSWFFCSTDVLRLLQSNDAVGVHHRTHFSLCRMCCGVSIRQVCVRALRLLLPFPNVEVPAFALAMLILPALLVAPARPSTACCACRCTWVPGSWVAFP